MIRLATAKDTQEVWQIRAQAILTACVADYPAEIVNQWANSPMPEDFDKILLKFKALVFEQNDQLLGFGFIDVETASLECLFVAPQSAGKGLGKALTIALEQQAFASGLSVLSLFSSLNAQGFYQAIGYSARESTTWMHPQGFELACVAMSKKLK